MEGVFGKLASLHLVVIAQCQAAVSSIFLPSSYWPCWSFKLRGKGSMLLHGRIVRGFGYTFGQIAGAGSPVCDPLLTRKR